MHQKFKLLLAVEELELNIFRLHMLIQLSLYKFQMNKIHFKIHQKPLLMWNMPRLDYLSFNFVVTKLVDVGMETDPGS